MSQKTTEEANTKPVFTAKDLKTDQDIRWCPGCGDYSILKQVQTVLPEFELNKEDIVFVSGIGCSSRFPYYLDTYGMHSIHGRATSIATGLKAGQPDLSVWVVTGDGDLLSIGGNHFAHILRRNPDVNILLFNNEIYGLTKGQYSPTSEAGKETKSTPFGSVDRPFNPLNLALGAGASFVARTMDRDPKHLQETLRQAVAHKGTSLIEIYQNCNIFNDGAFFAFSEKESKPEETVYLEEGKPLIYGHNEDKGIVIDGLKGKTVSLENGYSPDDLMVHDPYDSDKASLLVRFFDDLNDPERRPRPFGLIYKEERPTYEDELHEQLQQATERKGEGDLDALLKGQNYWVIEE